MILLERRLWNGLRDAAGDGVAFLVTLAGWEILC